MEHSIQDLKEFGGGERCYFPEGAGTVEEMAKDHYYRYIFAVEAIGDNKAVLDAACGSGYGSMMLAEKAKSVMGVDVSAHAIDFAKKQYKKDGLTFQVVDFNKKFPLADNLFDVIVSFETIEHLYGQDNMLSEFRRVLKPGGTLFISTPDNNLGSGGLPSSNPFHVKELKKDEFLELLHTYFTIDRLYGQIVLDNLPLWKQSIKNLRKITPLRKAKQWATKKLGIEEAIHKSLGTGADISIHETTEAEPNKYYQLLAVCKNKKS